tara:strand:- start:1117 stop:1356 length:240 start_codon:yes stop_codon:yes gene_type:complete
MFGESEEADKGKSANRGRVSQQTKASSSQSAALVAQIQRGFDGWSTQEALEKFGPELTEFEKIELGIYERIYTIGKVRR